VLFFTIGRIRACDIIPSKEVLEVLIVAGFMLEDYFRQYGLIAIFSVIAVIVPTSMLLMSHMASRLGIRPSNPTPVKLETYECGVETIGGRWNQFNFRYYLYAILFVIFDVEVVFLYPWATKFLSFELFALIEMGVFVLILLVGWAYAWRKGDLEWRS
jgi:NADH-quinone oxidoreductase subunit A